MAQRMPGQTPHEAVVRRLHPSDVPLVAVENKWCSEIGRYGGKHEVRMKIEKLSS